MLRPGPLDSKELGRLVSHHARVSQPVVSPLHRTNTFLESSAAAGGKSLTAKVLSGGVADSDAITTGSDSQKGVASPREDVVSNGEDCSNGNIGEGNSVTALTDDYVEQNHHLVEQSLHLQAFAHELKGQVSHQMEGFKEEILRHVQERWDENSERTSASTADDHSFAVGKQIQSLSAAIGRFAEKYEDITNDVALLREQLTSSVESLSLRLDRMGADFEKRLQNLQAGVPPVRFDSESWTKQIEANSQLSNVVSERLGEVLKLTNMVIGGTENLSKKLESESAIWRSVKLQNEARLNNLEKAICRGSTDAMLIQESEQLLAAANVDIDTGAPLPNELKSTLQTLVSKLNTALQPEQQFSDGSSARAGSCTVAAARSNSRPSFVSPPPPIQARAQSPLQRQGYPYVAGMSGLGKTMESPEYDKSVSDAMRCGVLQPGTLRAPGTAEVRVPSNFPARSPTRAPTGVLSKVVTFGPRAVSTQHESMTYAPRAVSTQKAKDDFYDTLNAELDMLPRAENQDHARPQQATQSGLTQSIRGMSTPSSFSAPSNTSAAAADQWKISVASEHANAFCL